ncbi:MAG: SAM-dependent methyltransferase [Chloroflexota bacterium]|nr:SAM-dependent methyltransferase [Chloroflexota bacterium]
MSPLADLIAAEIAARGPLTFARFMALALYHPTLGYYSRGAGIGRDFHTSPELHPLFGALLARQLIDCWEKLDRPSAFDLVELGGGNGGLAASLIAEIRYLAPQAAAALRYRIVETSRALRARQRARLAGLGVTWGGMPAAIEGVVLSNEFFDALPVHLVTVRNGRLRERYVGLNGGALCLIEGPPSTPQLAAYFRRVGVSLPEGYQTEVNLAATRAIRRIGRALRRGWVITIDYGYPAALRYGADYAAGTLTCYHGGTVNYDPLAWVGEQDLTAHIDFTALSRWGAACGLQPIGLITQREFLRNLGLDAYLHALSVRPLDLATWEWNREAIAQLAAPGGLGRFLVFAQAKGDVPLALAGFTGELRAALIRERARLRIPLLGGNFSEADASA